MKAEPASPPRISRALVPYVGASASNITGRSSSIQPVHATVARVKSEAPDVKPMLSNRRNRLSSTRSPTASSSAKGKPTSTPRRRATTTPSRSLALGSSAAGLSRSQTAFRARSNSRARSSTARSQSRSETLQATVPNPKQTTLAVRRSVTPLQRRSASVTSSRHRSQSLESEGHSHVSLSMEPSVPPQRQMRPVIDRPMREQPMMPPMGPPPDPIKAGMAQAMTEIQDLIRQVRIVDPGIEAEDIEVLGDLLRTSFGSEGKERGELVATLQMELDYEEFATGSHLSNLLFLLERGCSRVVQHRLKNPLSKGKNSNAKDLQFMNTLYVLLDDTRDASLANLTPQQANKAMVAWRIILVNSRDSHTAKLQEQYPEMDKYLLSTWNDCLINLCKAVITETWP